MPCYTTAENDACGAIDAADQTYTNSFDSLSNLFDTALEIIDNSGNVTESHFGGFAQVSASNAQPNNSASNNTTNDSYGATVLQTFKGMLWTGPKRLIGGTFNVASSIIMHPIQSAENAYWGTGEIIYGTSTGVYNAGAAVYTDPKQALADLADKTMYAGNYYLDNPEELGAAYFNASASAVTGKASASVFKKFTTPKDSPLSKFDTKKDFGAHTKGSLPENIAATFRGGSYTERTLTEDLIVYRVHGGDAKDVGSFFTTVKPQGALQARMDLAIDPKWGNDVSEVSTFRIPKGTVIYEGHAAPQIHLQGGGTQIHIQSRVESDWIIDTHKLGQ